MLDEKEVIEKLIKGDIDAFEQIFEQYKSESKRLAYMITGNLADSEDVVQEAFIQCYRKVNKLKEIERFRAWFFRILTRTAWKYCKYHKTILPMEDISEIPLLNEESENSVTEVFLRNEEAEILYQAVLGLEKKQRTAVILYYYNNLPIKEISLIMGCTEGTVKSRLFTARKNLKNILKSRETMEIEKEVEKNAKFKTVG